MATLRSEDTDTASSLELRPRQGEGFRLLNGQLWQSIDLILTSGKRTLETTSNEAVQLCRLPHDEIAELVDFLSALAARDRTEVIFEPSEPSFEMNFQTTHGDLIKTECWLDAGNGETGFYTFDACGIRFCTTTELVEAFINELEKDFPPPEASNNG